MDGDDLAAQLADLLGLVEGEEASPGRPTDPQVPAPRPKPGAAADSAANPRSGGTWSPAEPRMANRAAETYGTLPVFDDNEYAVQADSEGTRAQSEIETTTENRGSASPGGESRQDPQVQSTSTWGRTTRRSDEKGGGKTTLNAPRFVMGGSRINSFFKQGEGEADESNSSIPSSAFSAASGTVESANLNVSLSCASASASASSSPTASISASASPGASWVQNRVRGDRNISKQVNLFSGRRASDDSIVYSSNLLISGRGGSDSGESSPSNSFLSESTAAEAPDQADVLADSFIVTFRQNASLILHSLSAREQNYSNNSAQQNSDDEEEVEEDEEGEEDASEAGESSLSSAVREAGPADGMTDTMDPGSSSVSHSSVSSSSSVVTMLFSVESTPACVKSEMLPQIIARFDGAYAGLTAQDVVLQVLGIPYFLTSDSTPMRRTSFFQICNKAQARPAFVLRLLTEVRAEQPEFPRMPYEAILSNAIASELKMVSVLSTLAGTQLQSALTSHKAEVIATRSRFARLRLDARRREDKRQSIRGVPDWISRMRYLGAEPLPKVVPATIQILCHLPGLLAEKRTKLVAISLDKSADDLCRILFQKWSMSDNQVSESGRQATDYLVKVRGLLEVLLGVEPLIDFDYMRLCVSKGVRAELSLVSKKDVFAQLGRDDIKNDSANVEEPTFDRILAGSDAVFHQARAALLGDSVANDKGDKSLSDVSASSNAQDSPRRRRHRHSTSSTLSFVNLISSYRSTAPFRIGFSSISLYPEDLIRYSTYVSLVELSDDDSISVPLVDANHVRVYHLLSNFVSQQALSHISSDLLASSDTTLLGAAKKAAQVISKDKSEGLPPVETFKGPLFAYIFVELTHGDTRLAPPVASSCIPLIPRMAAGSASVAVALDATWSNTDTWIELLNNSGGRHSVFGVRNLPRAAKVGLTMYLTKNGTYSASSADGLTTRPFPDDIPVGWANRTVFEHDGVLRHGRQPLHLWPLQKANPIGTCVDNVRKQSRAAFGQERTMCAFPPQVICLLDEDNSRIRYSCGARRKTRRDTHVSAEVGTRLNGILNNKQDLLSSMLQDEKQFVWRYRNRIDGRKPQNIAAFARCVDYSDPSAVSEARRILGEWRRGYIDASLSGQPADFPYQDALCLLDASVADPEVRSIGVFLIENFFADGELYTYLLQLVQTLKYEPYHMSALAQCLLKRAYGHVNRIGFELFWMLRAEIHNTVVAERYVLLLECYLRGCGAAHRSDLSKQHDVLDALSRIAGLVKTAKCDNAEARKNLLQLELSRVPFPSRWVLPLDARKQVRGGPVVGKCRYMDSKKMPLWVVFDNAEPGANQFHVIFKLGDDLRQDQLTLQMISLMDRFWKQDEDMNLRMKPYKVLSMGDMVGMVEVVLGADTLANINKQFGGARAVLQKNTLAKWLMRENPSPEQFERARDNFIFSCAGYCVATYVLGIGDRHNDNLMMTKDGHLFHIDFGHFLGNYKKKFGFKRERSPFIFTPQFASILGGRDTMFFKQFEKLSSRAFNIVRKHARLLCVMFELMLSTGIPELTERSDINYLVDHLLLSMTEREAAGEFEKLIVVAMKTKTTLVNDMVHIAAHS